MAVLPTSLIQTTNHNHAVLLEDNTMNINLMPVHHTAIKVLEIEQASLNIKLAWIERSAASQLKGRQLELAECEIDLTKAQLTSISHSIELLVSNQGNQPADSNKGTLPYCHGWQY